MVKQWLLGSALVALLAAPGASFAQDTTAAAAQRRVELERRLAARIGEVVRERLGLSADQTRRLQEVDRRYQPERRRLMHREMQARRELRQQIAAGDNADQRAIAALLDQLNAMQRDRLELHSREQRELAAFLTPLQRAQLLGLQADLHRRMLIMRRGRHTDRGARPGAGPEGRGGSHPPGERRYLTGPP